MSLRVTAQFGQIVTTTVYLPAQFDVGKFDESYFDMTTGGTITTVNGIPAIVAAQVVS